QEHRRVNRPAPASAGVDDVSDGGLDVVFVFVIQRQAPHLLPRFVVRFVEALVDGVIIGEDSGIRVAQRNHDSARQRCCINQMSASELARVEQTVGQYQSTFGVGIDDLN